MITDRLQKLLQKVIRELNIDADGIPIVIEKPRDPSHGDYATNLAMSLTKQLKRDPMSIADDIATNLSADPDIIERVEVAAPGFINFKLSTDYFIGQLRKIVQESNNHGKTNIRNGQKVMVEFVSSNPTGPLHIGHGRQAVLGDVISSLLEAIGCDVTREYYYNDAGGQLDKLGASIYARYRQLYDPRATFPEDGYLGEYIVDIAKKISEDHGDRYLKSDVPEEVEETMKFMRLYGCEEMIRVIDQDLKDFRIYFDEWTLESSFYESGKIEETLKQLGDNIYEKDGAYWFRSSDYGDDEDRVVIKSTGVPTYFLPDIAYHIDKRNRKFDLVINIHGADHHGYIPRMKAAMKALDFPDNFLYYLVHQMVRFTKDGKEIPISTRAGTFITLRELFEEIGVDVARYFFVMRRAQSQLTFDLGLAKTQSEENPAYYVQYAHARTANVFAFAKESGIEFPSGGEINLKLLTEAEELDLIKTVTAYPQLVVDAAYAMEPHRITSFLEDVAAKFHLWYHNCRIVTQDKELTFARLYLTKCVNIVIKNGLALLGVSQPEKM